MRILVTGATGYIGGRLVPRLLQRGHDVTVLVRDPRRIAGREWAGDVTVATGDLLDPRTLPAAFEGIDTAYYLVHSMYGGADFARRDREAAEHFAAAAAASGVARVVYLGGLQPRAVKVSAHLASRGEVGEVLRRTLPTTEIRAGPIIGSGSASFEMVRYLTERLPVMIAPRWILNRVQPIAVRDVLQYLLLAAERPPLGVVDVGAEALSFREMMLGYAEVQGLHRIIIPVPVLAPTLAALWVGLVTPLPNSIAVPLIGGVVHPVLADTTLAREHFPEIEPLDYKAAVSLAVERTSGNQVTTAWSGALNTARPYELTDREGVIREVRTLDTRASAERLFAVVSSLGGDKGWLAWDLAWKLRGMLDRLVGGPGLRRGRRDPQALHPGEAVDFWRVEVSEPPTRLRLRAEMKVPGRAWLQWELRGATGGKGARLQQTAIFAPRGIMGVLYWYVLYPIHGLIFSAMARAIVREAERPAPVPRQP